MLIKTGRAWLVSAITLAVATTPAVCASGAQDTGDAPEKAVVEGAIPTPPPRSPRPGDVTKVFVLQHVGARGLAELLRVFPATITYPTYGPIPNQAIGVSAAPGVVAAIEATIKRLDVPPAPRKSVELTGYVLESLDQPLESAPLPTELDGVVTQLKRAFSYPAYRLLDTLIARGVDGSRLDTTALSSEAQSPPSAERTTYVLSARSVHVLTGPAGPTVRLEHLAFLAQIPVPRGPNASLMTSVGIHTDVEIQAGQRVVVGKTGSPEQPPKAIFLVLSAKVSD